MEERDERLVGSLNDHELERVAIEGNALERRKNTVQESPSSDWNTPSDPDQILVCGDHVLLPIPTMSLSPKTPFS
jgi:hypothetical protein